MFTSPARDEDGHQKWIDFVQKFWHAECISSLSKSVFLTDTNDDVFEADIIIASHMPIKYMLFQKNAVVQSKRTNLPNC